MHIGGAVLALQGLLSSTSYVRCATNSSDPGKGVAPTDVSASGYAGAQSIAGGSSGWNFYYPAYDGVAANLAGAAIAGNTTYTKNSLVNDGTNQYYCILAFTTGASPTAPGSDPTHWTVCYAVAVSKSSITFSSTTGTYTVSSFFVSTAATSGVCIDLQILDSSVTVALSPQVNLQVTPQIFGS